MGAAPVLVALLGVPVVLIGLCFLGVLPNPFLTLFADALHYLNRKGRFAPRKKRRFDYNQINENLFVGRQPRSIEDIRKLHEDHGVNAIVCMNRESELYVPSREIKKSDMELSRLHIPVPDYQGATQEQLKKAVRFIDKQVSEGSNVFIHCNGGKGRSAGVAAAYLMYKLNTFEDYHEAVDYVRKRRPVTSNGLDRFPISSSSRSLFVYHATLKQKGRNKIASGLSQYLRKRSFPNLLAPEIPKLVN